MDSLEDSSFPGQCPSRDGGIHGSVTPDGERYRLWWREGRTRCTALFRVATCDRVATLQHIRRRRLSALVEERLSELDPDVTLDDLPAGALALMRGRRLRARHRGGVAMTPPILRESVFKWRGGVGGKQDVPLAKQLKATREKDPQASHTYPSLAEYHSSFGTSDRGGSFGRQPDHRMHATTTDETRVQTCCLSYCPRRNLTGGVRRKTTRRLLPSYCSYCSYWFVLGGYVRAKPIRSCLESRYPLTPPSETSKNSKIGKHPFALWRFPSYCFSKRAVRAAVASSKEVAA